MLWKGLSSIETWLYYLDPCLRKEEELIGIWYYSEDRTYAFDVYIVN